MDSSPERSDAPSASQPAARFDIAACLAAIPRVYTAPRSVFAAIRAGMPPWPALVALAVLSLVSFYFYAPYMAEAFHSMIQSGQVQLPMQELKDLSREAFVAKARVPLGLMLAFFSILAVVIESFFYWLAVTVTFGSTPFGRIFTLRIYASFILFLFSLLSLGYLLVVKPEFSSLQEFAAANLDLSPALLLGEATGFMVRLLRNLNVFAVWQLVVFNAGVAYFLDRKWSQTLGPIGLIFLLGLVIQSISG